MFCSQRQFLKYKLLILNCNQAFTVHFVLIIYAILRLYYSYMITSKYPPILFVMYRIQQFVVLQRVYVKRFRCFMLEMNLTLVLLLWTNCIHGSFVFFLYAVMRFRLQQVTQVKCHPWYQKLPTVTNQLHW